MANKLNSKRRYNRRRYLASTHEPAKVKDNLLAALIAVFGSLSALFSGYKLIAPSDVDKLAQGQTATLGALERQATILERQGRALEGLSTSVDSLRSTIDANTKLGLEILGKAIED